MGVNFKSTIVELQDANTLSQATADGGMRVVKDLRLTNTLETAYFEYGDDPDVSGMRPFRTIYAASYPYFNNGTPRSLGAVYRSLDAEHGVVLLSHPASSIDPYGSVHNRTVLLQFVNGVDDIWDAAFLTDVAQYSISYMAGYPAYYSHGAFLCWLDADKTRFAIQLSSRVYIVRVDYTEKTLRPEAAFSLYNYYSRIASTTTDNTLIEFGTFGSSALQFKLHTYNPETRNTTSASTSTSTGVNVYNSSTPVFAARVNNSANEYVLVFNTSSNSTRIAHIAVDPEANSVSWGGTTNVNIDNSIARYVDILNMSTGSNFAYALTARNNSTSWNTSNPPIFATATSIGANPSWQRLSSLTGSSSRYMYGTMLARVSDSRYVMGAVQYASNSTNTGLYVMQVGSTSKVQQLLAYNSGGRLVLACSGKCYYMLGGTLYRVGITDSNVSSRVAAGVGECSIGTYIPSLTGRVRGHDVFWHPFRGLVFVKDGEERYVATNVNAANYSCLKLVTTDTHVLLWFNSSSGPNYNYSSSTNQYFRIVYVDEDLSCTSKYSAGYSGCPYANDVTVSHDGTTAYTAQQQTNNNLYLYKIPLSSYSASQVYGSSNGSYGYVGTWFTDANGTLLFRRMQNNNSVQYWTTSGGTTSAKLNYGDFSLSANGNVDSSPATSVVFEGGVYKSTSCIYPYLFSLVKPKTSTKPAVAGYAKVSRPSGVRKVFITPDKTLLDFKGSGSGDQYTSGLLHTPSGKRITLSTTIDRSWVFSYKSDNQPGIMHYRYNGASFYIEYIPPGVCYVTVELGSGENFIPLSSGIAVAPGDIVALSDVFYLGAGENLYIKTDRRRSVSSYAVVLDKEDSA